MFKTIEDCRLDLVAHSVKADIGGLEFDLDGAGPSMDYMPASAARVSFGNEDKTGKEPAKDRKLMEYLAEHEHMSPFEHQSATFLIEVPLFVRSQIHRHRTFAYNEISRRYTDENLEFLWQNEFRKQADNNRQASTDELIHDSATIGWDEDNLRDVPVPLKVLYQHGVSNAVDLYNDLLKSGVAREQARMILPQSLLTKFYMTGSLRNWAHFVKLRTHEGAQYEVRVVAERISAMLHKLWPNAWGVLLESTPD